MKHCTVLYMSHDCLRMFHDVLRLSHVTAKVCRFLKNRIFFVCSAVMQITLYAANRLDINREVKWED
jgi:hypothetical protein